jgi:hypothetical protein
MIQDQIQYGLSLEFHTLEQRFREWVHTPGGGWVANACIRYAYAFNREGKKRSMTLIWELVREDLRDYAKELSESGQKPKPVDGYSMPNGFRAYMSRFIESREPSLRGYFQKTSLRERKPKRAVVIPVG